jgi:hypothetical protein
MTVPKLGAHVPVKTLKIRGYDAGKTKAPALLQARKKLEVFIKLLFNCILKRSNEAKED